MFNQTNCIENCSSGVSASSDKNVYDFFYEESTFTSENVIQAHASEYAASFLVKNDTIDDSYTIVSHYLEGQYPFEVNRVQLNINMPPMIEIS